MNYELTAVRNITNLNIYNYNSVERYLTWEPFAVEGVSKVDAVAASIDWFMQALVEFDRNKPIEENPHCFYPTKKKWKVLSSYADTRHIIASGSHNDSLYVVSGSSKAKCTPVIWANCLTHTAKCI